MQAAEATALSFVGEHLRFPSASQELHDAQDRLARNAKVPNATGKPGEMANAWDQLTGAQKAKALKDNPAQATKIAQLTEKSLADARPSDINSEIKTFHEIDAERMKQEAAAWSATPMKVDAVTGQPVKNMALFVKSYNDIQSAAANQKLGADKVLNAFVNQNGALPTDPAKAALAQYYKTIADSKQADGSIDWEHQGQLEADLRSTLTPGQNTVIDERAIGQHAPEIQPWVESKKYISDQGYWRIADQAVADIAKTYIGTAYPNIKPPATVLGLAQAESAALKAKDAALYGVLKTIGTTATKQADIQKQAARYSNPTLDRALQLVYGENPVGFSPPSKSGGGLPRRSSGTAAGGRRTLG